MSDVRKVVTLGEREDGTRKFISMSELAEVSHESSDCDR